MAKTERKDGQKRYFMAKFPLDEARCRLWVKVTGKEDLAYVPIEKLHDNKFICGKHFTDKDFKKRRTQLKNYAVPSVRLTAQPLSDEILRDFPLHVYRTPSISDEVRNSGMEVVNNNMFMNENKLIATTSKTTSAADSCTKRIYSEEEIPIAANILEIHTCDSTATSVDRPCNKQSGETSQVEIKTRSEEEMYRYIALNEWYNKKSLTYPTVKLCSIVEEMVKVFEQEVRPILHQSDIGKTCRLSMLQAIDTSWICATHWSEITDQLLMQISLLLIRNDCKKINRTFSETEESCADYNKKAQVMGIRR